MKEKYASKTAFINGEKYYNPKLAKTYKTAQCSSFSQCKTIHEENHLRNNRRRAWLVTQTGRDLNTNTSRNIVGNEYYSSKADYLQFSDKARNCNENIIDRDRQIHDRTISHEEKMRMKTQKHRVVKKDCIGNNYNIVNNEFIRGDKFFTL